MQVKLKMGWAGRGSVVGGRLCGGLRGRRLGGGGWRRPAG